MIQHRWFVMAALLCLVLSRTYAQKPLSVGDTLPSALWNLPLKVVNHPEGKSSITLSEYKDKLIILDFWATWCGPCVQGLGKIESLQKEFAKDVQIIPISYENEEVVLSFLNKYHKRMGYDSALPKVVAEKELHKAFPHRMIPHFVWIGRNREVVGITDYHEVNNQNIEKSLSATSVKMQEKKDSKLIEYDYRRPMFINNNGGDGSNLLFHTVFAHYKDGLTSGYYIDRENTAPYLTRTISARNNTISQLLSLAHGRGKVYLGSNRIIYETPDSLLVKVDRSLRGEEYREWMRKNTYCYEIIVPFGAEEHIYDVMIRDLDLMLPFTAKLERRYTKFYSLERTSEVDLMKSGGKETIVKVDPFGAKIQNEPISTLYNHINVLYLQRIPIPFINNVDYSGSVDLEFTADMRDIHSINLGLAKYHLKILEKEGDVDMLIISNKQNN